MLMPTAAARALNGPQNIPQNIPLVATRERRRPTVGGHYAELLPELSPVARQAVLNVVNSRPNLGRVDARYGP
jgi:hypothetical protein